MLDLFVKQACNPDGYMDLDIMYLSELDPTWNNDELAFSLTLRQPWFITLLLQWLVQQMQSPRRRESP